MLWHVTRDFLKSFVVSHIFSVETSFIFAMQITERKSELAKLEAIDCGKPLEEAAWDMVMFVTYRVVQRCTLLPHSSLIRLLIPSRMM